MVYCGKPSKACAECRLRRTKCDALRPSCSQCKRAGRLCTGYRDPSDLRFRDESQSIRFKRQRQPDSNSAITTTNTTSASTVLEGSPFAAETLMNPVFPPSSPGQSSAVGLLPLGLGTSAEEQATCFFFRNYVLGDIKFINGDFQFLPEVYLNQEVGTALSQSVTSLGMAGLAHFWGASSIMSQAQAKYNAALRLVSSLLRNIEDAKSDQTLMAVILLGLYEVNTCNSRQSMDSWTKHVDGACAVLNLRGKKQFETPVGRQLFYSVRGQVLTNCIQRHAPVPPHILEWSKIAAKFETLEQTAITSVLEISMKYAVIRSSMSSFHDYSNSEEIILALCAVDAEYADWVSQCPYQFAYTTVNLNERSEEVFSDHYHVYHNVGIAKIWNGYRCTRILVNELLVDQITHLLQNSNTSLPLPDATLSLYQNQLMASNSMVLQLAHDICASVPYFLGYDNATNQTMQEPPKAVSGNLLLWPLYTAAITPMVSPMMQEWVRRRLMFISDVIGIKQAESLASSLLSRKDISDFQVEDFNTT